MKTLDNRLVEIALERVQGHDFEKFAQSFFSAISGTEYVPLGGIHDGGADGWFAGSTFQRAGGNHFLQASVTQDAKTKIRSTVQRLLEFSRSPTSLTYITSKRVGPSDKLEEELSDELKCRIVIRDGQYITAHTNQSPQTIQAFNSYLLPTVDFLRHVGGASLISKSDRLPAQTLCVFMGQELERRRGNSQLLETVADSLILWSLEGTDPDQNIFLSRDQIEEKVLQAMPSAKAFIRNAIDARLRSLNTKTSASSRKINYHKNVAGYCLPFETRELIERENIEDEALRLEVSRIFRARAKSEIVDSEDNQGIIETIVEICHSAIQKTFHSQGLELAIFATNENEAEDTAPTVESHIDEALREIALRGERAGVAAKAALNILRRTFYQSTEQERKYLQKLSRTYVLMFLLQNEPRIVEYLRSMSSNFFLYVGSDIIVRCLSEHMLPPADRMTKNALNSIRDSGSKLILTDKSLDEVWHHLQTTHWEFQNNYFESAQFMTPDLVQPINKILIRAYFYSRFDAINSDNGKRKPITWDKYISQFCSAERISHTDARDELREYLINEFKFEFESNDEMETAIDLDQKNALARGILDARGIRKGREEESEHTLAQNAAAMILRVYSRRKENGERAQSNPYGYKTWWMTQQSRVRIATGELEEQQGRYMMRPEFIVHFFSSMPAQSDVRESYASVFPSLLGVKLGNRIDDKAFKTVISSAKKYFNEVDESRAQVILAGLASQLQSDFYKKYD